MQLNPTPVIIHLLIIDFVSLSLYPSGSAFCLSSFNTHIVCDDCLAI